METVSNIVVESGPTLTNVDQITYFLRHLSQNETETAVRSYTKRKGFNALSPLPESDTDTLVSMSAAISLALANRVTAGDETARNGLQLVADYAFHAPSVVNDILESKERVANLMHRAETLYNAAVSLNLIDQPETADRFAVLAGARYMVKLQNYPAACNDLIEWINSELESVETIR